MRPGERWDSRLVKAMFQYRERVTPFAAPQGRTVEAGPFAFQYRERVTPFAAIDVLRQLTCLIMFQYRERVTPFAA